MTETTPIGPVPMVEETARTVKSDTERLLDAHLLIGMIERYRPGTAQEARDWFAEHLRKEANDAQS